MHGVRPRVARGGVARTREGKRRGSAHPSGVRGNGRSYPELAALRAELVAGYIASEVVAVNYEFFVGSGSMLVLKRASS